MIEKSINKIYLHLWNKNKIGTDANLIEHFAVVLLFLEKKIYHTHLSKFVR